MMATRPEIEDLLYHEARLLDERRFEEWLDLFTQNARYVMPSGDSEDTGIETPILDDDRLTLEDRVLRLRNPASYAQSPPSRTVHLVQNVQVEPDGPAAVNVHCVLVVYEARLESVRSFAARCFYRLIPEDGGTTWRIAMKRVELVNRDQHLYNLTFLF